MSDREHESLMRMTNEQLAEVTRLYAKVAEQTSEIARLRGKLQEIVDKYHPDGNPMYLHDLAFEALQRAAVEPNACQCGHPMACHDEFSCQHYGCDCKGAAVKSSDAYRVQCRCGWIGLTSELVRIDDLYECPACNAGFRSIFDWPPLKSAAVAWIGGYEWQCTCGRRNAPGNSECGGCHCQPHAGCVELK